MTRKNMTSASLNSWRILTGDIVNGTFYSERTPEQNYYYYFLLTAKWHRFYFWVADSVDMGSSFESHNE